MTPLIFASATLERLRLVRFDEWVAAAVVVSVGVALLLFGQRLYRWGLLLCGGIVGAGIGVWLSRQESLALDPQIASRLGLVGGLVGALAAWPLEALAVFAIGGSLGVMAVAAVALHLQSQQPAVAAVMLALAGLAWMATGYLAVKLRRTMICLATAAWGALLVIAVPLALLTDPASLTDHAGLAQRLGLMLDTLHQTPVVTAGWLVLAGVGAAVQLGVMSVAALTAQAGPAAPQK